MRRLLWTATYISSAFLESTCSRSRMISHCRRRILGSESTASTRAVLDTLCHQWGLYFSSNKDMTSESGACDLHAASTMFRKKVPRIKDRAFSRSMACLHFGSILLARLLLLREFVGGKPKSKTRMRKWIIAQRFPA